MTHKFRKGQSLLLFYKTPSDPDGKWVHASYIEPYEQYPGAASYVLYEERRLAVWDSCLRTASPDNYGDEDDT